MLFFFMVLFSSTFVSIKQKYQTGYLLDKDSFFRSIIAIYAPFYLEIASFPLANRHFLFGYRVAENIHIRADVKFRHAP